MLDKKTILVISIIIFASIKNFNSFSFYEALDKSNILDKPRDPDELKTIDQIIVAHRYPLETHYITTEDGYILKLFRITGKKHFNPDTDESNKFDEKFKNIENVDFQPILFQHGLVDSSDAWVCNSEDYNYPYILANKGFDVWLGNNRGNKHSRNHVSLNPNSKEFWNYSFHEMGLNDDPVVIKYILEHNKKHSKIIYVGHSQGCNQFNVMCSLMPEFCKKNIKGMIALGPAILIDNNNAFELKLALKLGLINVFKLLRTREIFPMRDSIATKIICHTFVFLCNKSIQYLSDADPVNDNNQKRINVYYSHYPSGTSLKTLNHFKKLIDKKKFVELDSDKEYPIENINVPMYIHVGKHDLLVTPKDARRYVDSLNKEYVKFYHEYDHIGHLTFFMIDGQDNYVVDVLDNINDIMKNDSS